MDAVEDLYLRIADRYTGIRRIEVCANRVAPENYVQYSLFDDPKQTDKERHLQEAVLNVKQRYGKNAIMRGSNLLECSSYRERNDQIGGHRAERRCKKCWQVNINRIYIYQDRFPEGIRWI